MVPKKTQRQSNVLKNFYCLGWTSVVTSICSDCCPCSHSDTAFCNFRNWWGGVKIGRCTAVRGTLCREGSFDSNLQRLPKCVLSGHDSNKGSVPPRSLEACMSTLAYKIAHIFLSVSQRFYSIRGKMSEQCIC